MKKKVFPFCLSLILLTGCGPRQDAAALSKAAVAELKVNDKTHYSVNVEGHIAQFENFQEPLSEYELPGEEMNFGRSYVLRIPTKINKANFYPESEDEAVSRYAYGLLESVLETPDDHINKMTFKMDGENLVFQVRSVSKIMNFYNVEVTGGVSSEPVHAYGRYNVTITYSAQGLLLNETCVTVNDGVANPKETIHAVAEYTYR